MGTPRNNQRNENGKCLMGRKNINDFYVIFARTHQDHTFAARIQIGTPRDSQRNENGKCLMGKKTWTTFMWNLRAPVRITLLLQGSKWGPQGTTKGKQMENVWWVEKHKRFLCDFWAHLSGSHFCSKDPSWDPKGRLKEWNWEMSDGGKNRNDFYVNFARACQDHTFAARIQVGTPRDSQRNETGKCLMGKKTETTFMWILRAPVRITLLQQGSKLGHQGTAKGMKLGNVWWVKKQKRLLCEFCAHLSGSHFCSKDPS